MANTMVKISSVTVGVGGAANIDFTNIPQTFTDLRIVASLRLASGGDGNLYYKFNNSSTNYTYRSLYGSGSTVGSGSGTDSLLGIITGATNTASVFGSIEIYIPEYTSSKNKSVIAESFSENNSAGAYQYPVTSLWSNTSAITQVTLYEPTVNLAQFSSATLYGILKA